MTAVLKAFMVSLHSIGRVGDDQAMTVRPGSYAIIAKKHCQVVQIGGDYYNNRIIAVELKRKGG
jgi:hypothetical protein